MKNENRQSQKVIMILLCIFALIGVIAVIAGGVFFGMLLANKDSKETVSVNDEIKEVTLDKIDTDELSNVIKDALTSETTALEQQNLSKTIAEDKFEANGTLDDAVIPEAPESKGEETIEFTDEDKLQVVFLGDSIFDFHREDGTAVPALVGQKLDANVINLAIGGLSASIAVDENTGLDNWNSTSGCGLAHYLAGEIDGSGLTQDYTAVQIIRDNMDKFADTDIFVVEYGLNDFFNSKPMDNMDNLNDVKSYQGAIQSIVYSCRKIAPDAQIVLCKPSYIEMYSATEGYLGNTYVMRNKLGLTPYDYMGKIDCVLDAKNEGDLWAFSTLEDNGINIYSASECLEDGVHLTEHGRQVYADMLSGYIKRNILKTEPPLP